MIIFSDGFLHCYCFFLIYFCKEPWDAAKRRPRARIIIYWSFGEFYVVLYLYLLTFCVVLLHCQKLPFCLAFACLLLSSYSHHRMHSVLLISTLSHLSTPQPLPFYLHLSIHLLSKTTFFHNSQTAEVLSFM
jgi:hypothetical protein